MTDISNREELSAYLRRSGILGSGEEAEIRYFPGGVSGAAALVSSANGEVLVKQAYERLKVAAEWKCDPRRIKVENDALSVYRSIVPQCVPAPVSFDDENWIMIREAVPDDWIMWKTDLLNGKINREVARKAIDALLAVHNATAHSEQVKSRFSDPQFFYELRVAPYIEYLLIRYPQLKEKAGALSNMLLNEKLALIHGDYSPKNILVKGDDICILDFEVAYYGNPCFDIAFFANHFLLKAVKNRSIADEYIGLLTFMLKRYFDGISYAGADKTEADSVRTLGFLLLARVDGKSPVEYITEESSKELVRRTALRVIEDDCSRFEQVFDILCNEMKKG